MNAQNSIQILQAYATGLAAQSMQHKVQSKVFKSLGLNKLAEKYADHELFLAAEIFHGLVKIKYLYSRHGNIYHLPHYGGKSACGISLSDIAYLLQCI